MRKTKLSRKSIYQIVIAVAAVVVPFAAAGFMATIGAAKDVFEYLVIYHIFSTFMFRMLNVKTGELLPHDVEYRSINQIPHNYVPEADIKTSVFWEFLQSRVPDPEDQRMLIEFMGYCMCYGIIFQKFMILVGRGNAGKSQILDTVYINGTTSLGGDLLTSGGIADGAGWMDFKYGGALYGSIYCNGTANHFEIVSRNGRDVAITSASGHIYARNTLHTEGGISNNNWMDWWYAGSDNLSIYVESRHAFIRANSGHLDILTQEALVQFVDYSWNAWAVLKAKQFAVQSSKRYKTNVVDMTEERAKRLLQMRPVSYDYTVMGCEKDQLGMIAEEVDAIDKFALSYDEYGRPDSLDYSKFVPQLIKLCQMQQTEIENIKMRLGNIGTVS